MHRSIREAPCLTVHQSLGTLRAVPSHFHSMDKKIGQFPDEKHAGVHARVPLKGVKDGMHGVSRGIGSSRPLTDYLSLSLSPLIAY